MIDGKFIRIKLTSKQGGPKFCYTGQTPTLKKKKEPKFPPVCSDKRQFFFIFFFISSERSFTDSRTIRLRVFFLSNTEQSGEQWKTAN
jgi:hypothetical protein